MRHIVITLSVFLCIFYLSSCKKFLDEKSDKVLVTPSTVSDLQALLDNSASMNIRTTPSLTETYADDYFLTQSTYDGLYDLEKQMYTWDFYNSRYENDWSYCYNPVYNANLCLEQIEKIPVTALNSLQWNNVKGSALFFRAYYFLNLAWEYAKAYDDSTAQSDLGIVLRLGSDYNIRSLRSSVKESYDQVIADTKESIAYLPANPQVLLRPSKVAAYGLLARTYLSMRQYDSAYKYADLILGLNDQLLDYNDLDLTSATPFPKLDNPETIFYTEEEGGYYLHYTWQAGIDTLLYRSYDSNDLRVKSFFYDNGGMASFKGSYAQDPYSFFSGIARDEIYLIRAECAARKGLVTDALHDLNNLLVKRWNNTVPFIGETAVDGADALNKILQERRKELLMRNLRWIDIKRLNKEGRDIVPERLINGTIYTLPVNDRRYAMPIPPDIIEITGIQQN